MGMLVMGVLLVSLASAGLVDFLSNEVSGSVEVSGPVFYLDMKDSGETNSFSLSMNDNDVDESGVDLVGGNGAVFLSDELGIDDFYKHNFSVNLDLEVFAEENKTNSIKIIISRANSNGNEQEEICNIIKLNGFDEEFICNVKNGGLSSFDLDSRLRLKVSDNSGPGANETLNINGDSYIQVVVE